MSTQTQVVEKSSFPALLDKFLPEIKRALPKHLDGDRMARIALTAFRRTPKLADCDPRSVFAAVIQASQLGLEPDTLGRSYLVPYKKSKKVGKEWQESWECNFIPGWRGLVDLVSRAGQAAYAPEATATPTKDLPAVSIQINGAISLISNLDAFGKQLNAFVENINQKPETDQEFADAEAAIKTLDKAESRTYAKRQHQGAALPVRIFYRPQAGRYPCLIKQPPQKPLI